MSWNPKPEHVKAFVDHVFDTHSPQQIRNLIAMFNRVGTEWTVKLPHKPHPMEGTRPL